MWQKLQQDMSDKRFTVLAVATDEPDAARPWIEAAKPSYPCLVDRDHHLDSLFNLVNVPQAIWINENGRIVRPPENAGSDDGFRRMDRVTKTLAPEIVAERARIKVAYFDAVRDWIEKGDRSEHVLDAQKARENTRLPDENVALSHAHFQLGQLLLRRGRADEAERALTEASQLNPDSWSIWRQALAKDPASGLATGPAFWARLDALGDRPYYPPIDIKGLRKGV